MTDSSDLGRSGVRCEGAHLPPREVTETRWVGVVTVPARGTCRYCGREYELQRCGAISENRVRVRAHLAPPKPLVGADGKGTSDATVRGRA